MRRTTSHGGDRRVGRLALLLTVLLTAGLLTAAPAVAAAPTITSFTPTSGKLNTPVTITGTGFAAPATVRFGGVAAGVVSVKSATSIVANVPISAPSGKISVTTAGGTAYSTATFTVTPGLYASLAGVGPPTSTRTVYFSGFGRYEAVDVYFDTTDLALGSADVNGVGNVSITVPKNATPGAHTVTAVGRHSGYSAQTPFTVRTDWPEYGYNPQHRATNFTENQLTAGNVEQLEEAWRATYGGEDNLYASPAVVGGVVYEGFTDGKVRAFDETTGAPRWTFTTGSAVYSSPAVVGGSVYFGDEAGDVVALNASTGTMRWSFPTGDETSSAPAVSGSSVYVQDAVGRVFSINTSTGVQNWFHDLPAAASGGSAAVANGLVFAADGSGGDVSALNAATGEQVWSNHYGADVYTDPVVANGHVYFADSEGSVHSVVAATGTSVWTHLLTDTHPRTLAVGYGRVFVGTGGTVTALRAGTGDQDWATSVATLVPGGLTVANGLLYESGYFDTHVLGVGEGDLLTTIGAGGTGPAVVADGTITIASYTEGAVEHLVLPPSALRASARPDPARLRPDRSLHRQD